MENVRDAFQVVLEIYEDEDCALPDSIIVDPVEEVQ
jgi:hypothetical protein